MKISIVTVTFNSASTIRDTLESIRSQEYDNIEHIIIDGNSTDDTMKIVKEFPHVCKIVSEKDKGVYDAMNKGIKLATGNVIGILNSDDMYCNPLVLSKVMHLFEETGTACVYGDLQYVDTVNINKVLRTWRSGRFKRSKFYYGWMPPHPTFFVRRDVYQEAGLFNTFLRTSSDYELMLRVLFRYGFEAVYLPEILVKMRTGGLSNASLSNRITANKEDRMAWKLNELEPYFFTLYIKPLRKVFQFFKK